MKNSLFLVNRNFDNSSGPDKKISAQVIALTELSKECYFSYYKKENNEFKRLINDEVVGTYKNNLLGKVKLRMGLLKVGIFAKKNLIELAYIRYEYNPDIFFIIFLWQLKKSKIKVFMEIPTYPYINEIKNNSLLLSYIKKIKEKLYTNLFHKYLYRVVTFSSDNLIWKVTCVNISNAVSTAPEIFQRFIYKERRDKFGVINFVALASFNDWHGYDRFLNGLVDYHKTEAGRKNIILHIIGSGRIIDDYKSFAANNGIEDYIIYHGFLTGNSLKNILTRCDIGLDSLGRHRSSVNENSSLKSKEYLLYGMPCVKSHIDPSIDSTNYYYQLESNDTPVPIKKIIDWYLNSKFTGEEISSFAKENFTWKIQLNKVLAEIKN